MLTNVWGLFKLTASNVELFTQSVSTGRQSLGRLREHARPDGLTAPPTPAQPPR